MSVFSSFPDLSVVFQKTYNPPEIVMWGDKISPVQPTVLDQNIDFLSIDSISNAYSKKLHGYSYAFDILCKSNFNNKNGNTMHFEWSYYSYKDEEVADVTKKLQERVVDPLIDLWRKIKHEAVLMKISAIKTDVKKFEHIVNEG